MLTSAPRRVQGGGGGGGEEGRRLGQRGTRRPGECEEVETTRMPLGDQTLINQPEDPHRHGPQ